ncbi:conjugal transfer protein TraX [Salmonella enterica]|nr:conjugal transfer protein TraX [Salmonella enterica]
MSKLPDDTEQEATVKKSPSIARLATRGVVNIFVPVIETRWIARSCRHMLSQQIRRIKELIRRTHEETFSNLSWEEAVQTSGLPVTELNRCFRRRRLFWRALFWLLLIPAVFLCGMAFAASTLPLITLLRLITTIVLMITGVALCASKALITSYRLWQLHERKVSEAEKGTFLDFLNDRNGWCNASWLAITSKKY